MYVIARLFICVTAVACVCGAAEKPRSRAGSRTRVVYDGLDDDAAAPTSPRKAHVTTQPASTSKQSAGFPTPSAAGQPEGDGGGGGLESHLRSVVDEAITEVKAMFSGAGTSSSPDDGAPSGSVGGGSNQSGGDGTTHTAPNPFQPSAWNIIAVAVLAAGHVFARRHAKRGAAPALARLANLQAQLQVSHGQGQQPGTTRVQQLHASLTAIKAGTDVAEEWPNDARVDSAARNAIHVHTGRVETLVEAIRTGQPEAAAAAAPAGAAAAAAANGPQGAGAQGQHNDRNGAAAHEGGEDEGEAICVGVGSVVSAFQSAQQAVRRLAMRGQGQERGPQPKSAKTWEQLASSLKRSYDALLVSRTSAQDDAENALKVRCVTSKAPLWIYLFAFRRADQTAVRSLRRCWPKSVPSWPGQMRLSVALYYCNNCKNVSSGFSRRWCSFNG